MRSSVQGLGVGSSLVWSPTPFSQVARRPPTGAPSYGLTMVDDGRSGTGRGAPRRCRRTGRWWRWRARSSPTACPRPRNVEVARADRADRPRHGAVPATIGMIAGERRRRPGRRRAGAGSRPPTRWRSCRSGTSRSPRRPGVDGATTVAATAALAARAGIALFATGGLGGVHRGAGRDLRRVGRPGRPRPYADHGRLRGREVHPRRGRHAGAAGDPRRHGRRLPHPAVPRLLPHRQRLRPGLVRGHAGASSPACMRPAGAQGVHAGAVVVANPLPVDEQLDPALHDRVLTEGLAGLARDGITGKAVTPYLLAHFHEATDGREPGRQHPDHPAQRRTGRRIAVAHAARPSRPLPSMTVLVVGDIVTDILAVHSGPLAVGSDTPAGISLTGGGSAANTAAWLASLGRPVDLVGVAGDGRGRRRPARRAGRGRGRLCCGPAQRRTAPTGSVIVLAHAEERSMLCDRGANLLLVPSDVDAALAAAPAVAHLHLSGYTLLDGASRPAGRHALAAAAERGLTHQRRRRLGRHRCAGSAAARSSTGYGARTSCSRTSTRRRTLLDDEVGRRRTSRALALAPHARASWWSSSGPDGAVWAGGTAPWSGRRPSRRPSVVDPTGAGDAFAAGVLAALAGRADPRSPCGRGPGSGAEAVGRWAAGPRAGSGQLAAQRSSMMRSSPRAGSAAAGRRPGPLGVAPPPGRAVVGQDHREPRQQHHADDAQHQPQSPQRRLGRDERAAAMRHTARMSIIAT